MPWTPSNLIEKGVLRSFHQAMEASKPVWPNHCMEVSSTTATETYAFPGFIPQPREFISGRQFQGLLDFTFNVTNKRYELSFAINRAYFADDQTGLIQQRINEAAEVVASYGDYRFASLLENGNVSGNNGWDGTIFHGDTRTIGSSANIDNSNTSAAATGTVPTSAEFLSAVADAKTSLWGFQDDTGRPFNVQAITKLRTVIPPAYERAAVEAVNSTFISNSDNPWGRGITEVDILPYLTDDTDMWINAVGSSRMPFIHQTREPLEIVVDQRAETVAKEDAVLVMCYWRDAFAYGEPRRSILHVFS